MSLKGLLFLYDFAILQIILEEACCAAILSKRDKRKNQNSRKIMDNLSLRKIPQKVFVYRQ